MNRLFWEETIRVFEPQHPQFHCSCTREKVGNMLKMLGQPEVERRWPTWASWASTATSAASTTPSTRSTAPSCSPAMQAGRAR
jgi:hypothetical protein